MSCPYCGSFDEPHLYCPALSDDEMPDISHAEDFYEEDGYSGTYDDWIYELTHVSEADALNHLDYLNATEEPDAADESADK